MNYKANSYVHHNFKSGAKLLAAQMNDIDNQIEILTEGNEYATPEMFGAVGDGSTDDSTAIQKAINTGKSVKFRSDATYLIEHTLFLDQNTEDIMSEDKRVQRKGLIYDGGGCTIKHRNCDAICLSSAVNWNENADGSIELLDSKESTIGFQPRVQIGLDKCIIRNFNIICDTSNGNPRKQGMYVEGGNNGYFSHYLIQCVISDCSFSNQFMGIYLGGEYITIERCVFHECVCGIDDDCVSHMVVQNNRFFVCQIGIYATYPHHTIFDNNWFYGCGGLNNKFDNTVFSSALGGLRISGNAEDPSMSNMCTVISNNMFINSGTINATAVHIEIAYAFNLCFIHNILDGFNGSDGKPAQAFKLFFCKNIDIIDTVCLKGSSTNHKAMCSLHVSDYNSRKNTVWSDINPECIYIHGGNYESINIDYGYLTEDTPVLCEINIKDVKLESPLSAKELNTTVFTNKHYINAYNIVVSDSYPTSDQSQLNAISYLKNSSIDFLDTNCTIKTIGSNSYKLTEQNDSLTWIKL